jgi:hypothetical protein
VATVVSTINVGLLTTLSSLYAWLSLVRIRRILALGWQLQPGRLRQAGELPSPVMAAMELWQDLQVTWVYVP